MKISEIFGPTLQGEGPFIGQKAVFIRTFGCIKPFCSFCDTPWALGCTKEKGKNMSVNSIIRKVKKLMPDGGLVVITGGEPFIQKDIYELINKCSINYPIQIETSGKARIENDKLLPIKIRNYSNRMHCNTMIVMSPKKYGYDNGWKIADIKTFNSADIYKFVIGSKEDAFEALNLVKYFDENKSNVYFMPLGADRKTQLKNMPMVAELCIKHNVKMAPRLHTLIWDNKRGV